MQRIIFFFILYFCIVSFSFCGELKYASSYVIPNGSFLRLEEYDSSLYYGVKLYFYAVLLGEKADWWVDLVKISKANGDVTILPVYYASGNKVNDNKYVLQGIEYNLYPDGVDEPVIELPTEPETIDKGVYLNRIELYLLWLLCVQCISCGVLLFLCFKGFEKV